MSRILETGKNQITNPYKKGIHNGIDVVKEPYSFDNIIAHTEGEVVQIQTGIPNAKGSTGARSYGNYVKLKHSNGYYTLYAHMSKLYVQKGDKVLKGQKLGYMGDTGNAYGAHLHFEVRNTSDVRIDPTPYIDNDLPNYESVENTLPTNSLVTIDALAQEVIKGKWGNGEDRKKRLVNAGYDYYAIQKKVNELLKSDNTETYTVQKGDNLSKIARKYNTTWQKLYEINKSIIGSNPNIIKVGQVLKIHE